MALKKTVECGVVVGYGTTIKEAKVDLDRRIKAALTGRYHPVVVSYGDYSAIVYREPECWTYKICEKSKMAQDGIHHIEWGGSYATQQEAIEAAAFHVVDLGQGDFHQDSDIPEWVTSKNHRQTILGNARFRRAYYFAKQKYPDLSRDELHRWGCEHSRDAAFA